MKPTYEGLTLNQLAERNAEHVTAIERLEAQVKQLAAERESFAVECAAAKIALAYWKEGRKDFTLNTPSVDAFLSRLRNEARAEVIPDGYVLVPQQMFLDSEDIESICSQCGNGAENEYGDYCDGLLWVGNIQDDAGNITHGLHISSADYPEDGGITLHAFPDQLREGKAGEVCNG